MMNRSVKSNNQGLHLLSEGKNNMIDLHQMYPGIYRNNKTGLKISKKILKFRGDVARIKDQNAALKQ